MCLKYQILRSCFLSLLVFCFFFLLFTPTAKMAVIDNFESYIPYISIIGQGNWQTQFATTSFKVIDNYANAYEGNKYLRVIYDHEGANSTDNRNAWVYFATTSSSTLCGYFNFNEINVVYHPTRLLIKDFNIPSAAMGFLVAQNGDLRIWNGSSYNTRVFTRLPLNTYNFLCWQWNSTQARIYANNQWSDWNNTGGSYNHFLIVGTIAYNYGAALMVDFLGNSTTTQNEAYIEGQITWRFPKSGWVLNNSEWNDWQVIIDMNPHNIGNFNILGIHYTDSNGRTTTDWGLITSTTTPFSWVINRSRSLPDGEVSSQAVIFKITNCVNYSLPSCIWETTLSSDIIFWRASSTGFTIFDNPYEIPSFIPASTTASSTEEAGWVNQAWFRLKNVFPLSLGFQLRDVFKNASEQGTAQASFNLPVNTILPPAMASHFATSVSLFSSSTLAIGLPFYSTTIYPALEILVYAGFIIFIIFIMWPRLKKATD